MLGRISRPLFRRFAAIGTRHSAFGIRLLAGVCVALAISAAAQQTPKVTLDVSPALFATTTAINACGYDAELSSSAPLRREVRAQVAQALQRSRDAEAVRGEMCTFYREHQQPDTTRDLAPYVSLALNLGDPPDFTPKVKESELPPDASYVLGFVPLLKKFYQAAGLQQVWESHRYDYNQLIERYHDPVANLLLATDVYLRLPISGYVGRRFTVYIEPMTAPAQINSRNYGDDYYMVVSPENGTLKMEQLRHTYLHFLLDPLVMKRANSLRKFQPVLKLVAAAPLDKSFKEDVSLLVTESLIRAVEARTLPGGRNAEPARQKSVADDMSEGFVLTAYFYDQLVKFETDPAGLQDAFPDWLYYFDLDHERKRIEEVRFASKGSPEIVTASNTGTKLLQQAERKMADGDYNGARQLAEEAMEKGVSDPGQASFLIAQAATQTTPPDVEGARTYFEKTLRLAKNPRLVAWSHIYLGRILDMSDRRDEAVEHYRAALAADDKDASARAAAERGLKQPFQKPASKPE